MSNFVSLNTALTALRAAQTGIDTSAHNIANANTPGFTRQRMTITTNTPFQSKVGPIGTGVDVESISRLRDEFLDLRLHTSNSTLGRLEVSADLLSRAEALLNEPEAGVSTELNELFAAFDELSLHPGDEAVRTTVLSVAETVASRIRTVAASYVSLADDVQTQFEDALTKVNDQLEQAASLNQQIHAIQGASGGVPNDLLDRRDLLIDELSRSLGVTSAYDQDGSVRISLNGFDLVSGSRANTLELQSDGSLLHPSGQTVAPGGRVEGLQEFVLTTMPDLQDDLDDFVSDLVTQLNGQHALGLDLDGNPGGVLFNAPTGADSIDVAFSDPRQLAAASAGPPAEGLLGAGNAKAMSDLRTTPFPPATASLGDQMRGFVTSLGARVASVQRQSQAEGAINAAASEARTDQHSVSLDEEMVSLMTFQRAYEAAARVATAVDEAMDTLVNRLGIVGR